MVENLSAKPEEAQVAGPTGHVGPTLMALDVAFAHVGVVILDYHESQWVPIHATVLNTEKDTARTSVRVADDNFRRCQEMYAALVRIGEEYHAVAAVAELPSGGSKSAIAMAAMARGSAVFACVASALKLVVECTTPGAGKKALGGAANASKQDMMRAALAAYPGLRRWFQPKRGKPDELENEFEHVADAIGAFCAARGGVAEQLVVQLNTGGSR